MLSDRIRAVREALHLSQREFGEKLGVSRDVVSNMEYDRVKPKALFLSHMCQLYQINEDWLETGEGEMFSGNPEEYRKAEEALKIFQALRPEFQDYALEQIRGLSKLQRRSGRA